MELIIIRPHQGRSYASPVRPTMSPYSKITTDSLSSELTFDEWRGVILQRIIRPALLLHVINHYTTCCFEQLCDPAPLFAIIGAPYRCSSPPKAENVATPLQMLHRYAPKDTRFRSHADVKWPCNSVASGKDRIHRSAYYSAHNYTERATLKAWRALYTEICATLNWHYSAELNENPQKIIVMCSTYICKISTKFSIYIQPLDVSLPAAPSSGALLLPLGAHCTAPNLPLSLRSCARHAGPWGLGNRLGSRAFTGHKTKNSCYKTDKILRLVSKMKNVLL